MGLNLGQILRLEIGPDMRYSPDELLRKFAREAFFPVWVYVLDARGAQLDIVGRIPLFTAMVSRVEHFVGAPDTLGHQAA